MKLQKKLKKEHLKAYVPKTSNKKSLSCDEEQYVRNKKKIIKKVFCVLVNILCIQHPFKVSTGWIRTPDLTRAHKHYFQSGCHAIRPTVRLNRAAPQLPAPLLKPYHSIKSSLSPALKFLVHTAHVHPSTHYRSRAREFLLPFHGVSVPYRVQMDASRTRGTLHRVPRFDIPKSKESLRIPQPHMASSINPGKFSQSPGQSRASRLFQKCQESRYTF